MNCVFHEVLYGCSKVATGLQMTRCTADPETIDCMWIAIVKLMNIM